MHSRMHFGLTESMNPHNIRFIMMIRMINNIILSCGVQCACGFCAPDDPHDSDPRGGMEEQGHGGVGGVWGLLVGHHT